MSFMTPESRPKSGITFNWFPFIKFYFQKCISHINWGEHFISGLCPDWVPWINNYWIWICRAVPFSQSESSTIWSLISLLIAQQISPLKWLSSNLELHFYTAVGLQEMLVKILAAEDLTIPMMQLNSVFN